MVVQVRQHRSLHENDTQQLLLGSALDSNTPKTAPHVSCALHCCLSRPTLTSNTRGKLGVYTSNNQSSAAQGCTQ